MRCARLTSAPLALASAISLALATGLPQIARAQNLPPPSATVKDIRIKAQPLAQALNELARQSGLQMSFPAHLVADKAAPAVEGSLTASQALQRLLQGSGLVWQMLGNTVVIGQPAPAGGSDVTLPPVTVTALAAGGRAVVPFVTVDTRSLGFRLPAQKTPAVVNTVTEEFWHASGSRSLDEVLSFVPGVNLTDNGGWTGDTLIIRGFAASIPYRDGLRQVDSGYGQSLRAMPDALERIEVVKGPAGAEFGVVEPGGAVNFVSKQPTRERVRNMSVGLGEDGYRKFSADFGGEVNGAGDVQARLVLAYAEPEEWRSGRPDNTFRYVIAPTINWDYSDRGKLTLGYERNFQNSPQDRGIIYLEGAWTGGFAPRDWSFHQTTSTQVNRNDRLRLQLEHRFSEALAWSTAVEHSRYHYHLTEFRNADSEPGWGSLYNEDGRSWSGERLLNLYWDNWTGDTRANALRSTLEWRFKALGAEHTLHTGIDLFRSTNIADSLYSDVSNTLDIFNPDNNQQPAFINKDYARWSSTIKVKDQGASVRWLGEWSERLRTIVGVRYADYSYDYDAAYVDYIDPANNYPWLDAYGSKNASMRVAASYDLTASHTLFAGISDGYVPQTGITRSGAAVDPIHDQALELGVKSQLADDRLAWTNSLFGIRRSGTTMNDPSNGPTDSFVVNGGEASIVGFESELAARVGKYLMLRGGLAVQKSRIEAHDNAAFVGNRFANTPERQLSLLARYTWGAFGLQDLHTDVGMSHIGQRWGNSGNTISLPSYTLLSLGASYVFASGTQLRLSVANITDETYYTGMQDSGARADQVMPGAPRSVFMTLTHDF